MITLEIPLQVDQELEKTRARKHCERVFLAEMLEVSGGIRKLADGMLEADYTQMCRLRESVKELADQIVDEIRAYRCYLDEETNGPSKATVEISGRECLARIRNQFRNHPITGDRQIVIAPGLGNLSLRTDPAVVGMILAHLTRNALESSAQGSTITLDGGRKPRAVWFSVHSPVPDAAQAASLHGPHQNAADGNSPAVGTTGIRLLAEQFLKGEVTFTSDPTLGTTFTVTLPDAGT